VPTRTHVLVLLTEMHTLSDAAGGRVGDHCRHVELGAVSAAEKCMQYSVASEKLWLAIVCVNDDRVVLAGRDFKQGAQKIESCSLERDA